MSAKKAPVRKLAAKKTSRSTQKSAPKKVAKTRPVKKPAKVAKKAAKKAAPARKTPKKTAKKAPTKKPSVKKATKKSAAKKVTKKSVKKVTKKVATKVAKKAPAKKAPQKTAKKAAAPSPTPKIAAPSPAPPIPVAKKKVPAKPKPAGKQEAPVETKPPSAPNAEIPAAPAKTITTSEPSHQALAPKDPIPKKEQKTKKPKLPAKRKTEETSAPPFSKEVKEALAVTPAIPLEEMPVLVCVQDPHPAPGILTLVEDSDVPAASGIPTQQWRLHAVLEQNPPRFFEGWATTGTFTLDVRVNASVKEKSGNWGGHTTISSGAKPCRITVSIGEGKQVKFSATEGVQHATGKHMPTEARYLIGDIAFTTKEGGVVEVAATSVICTEKWSHLIAHTAAATKGLAFDTRWGANLKANDGFTVAAGVWTFAVMTRGEYEDLRQKKNWPAREIEP